jgi:hypothetical protein
MDIKGGRPKIEPLPQIVKISPLAAIIVGWWRRRKAIRNRGVRPGWLQQLSGERICVTCERQVTGGLFVCAQCGGLLNPVRWMGLLFTIIFVFIGLPLIYMWWVSSRY